MKVLFVETKLSGHHKSYLESLVDLYDDSYIIMPKGDMVEKLPNNHQFFIDNNDKGILGYMKNIKQISEIAKIVEPDIIHFLYGDDLYRYFGMGIRNIYNKAKIIITCHQIRRSFFRDLSYKCIGGQSNAIVVHTDKLKKSLLKIGVKNVEHIEYPCFNMFPKIHKEEALFLLDINVPVDRKVLLSLGGTRKDKGLDLLIEALSDVTEDFHLIIAGQEQTFRRDFIEKKIEKYRDKVTLFLEYLSDEKLSLCLDASDILVLPYREEFDGASGPLGEGVWRLKKIVGSNHKSLGELIVKNHLGTTFECQNISSLINELNTSIKEDWIPDKGYLQYREELNPRWFRKKYYDLFQKLSKESS